MHSFTVTASLLAAIAALPAVSAHGYVANAIVGGKTVVVGSPNWIYSNPKPTQPGWFAYNQDNGFVSPTEYGDNNITCHKGATPGTSSITVAAGSTIGLQWNTWPDSHHGPILNYLAPVSGSFSSIDSSKLQWFAAQDGGLIDDSTPPGTWATDQLISNSFTGNFKVPSSKPSLR
jgi:lytic cellulose monooxygenase (C1-hydroxylating)